MIKVIIASLSVIMIVLSILAFVKVFRNKFTSVTLDRESVVVFSVTRKSHICAAISRAKFIEDHLPSWGVVLYCAENIPTHNLENIRNVKVINVEGTKTSLWLLRPVFTDDMDPHRILIRDVTCPWSSRDILAIDQWIKSGKFIHVVRDHIDHSREAMITTLCGFSGDITKDVQIRKKFRIACSCAPRLSDVADAFLSSYVYPEYSTQTHFSLPSSQMKRDFSTENSWDLLPAIRPDLVWMQKYQIAGSEGMLEGNRSYIGCRF